MPCDEDVFLQVCMTDVLVNEGEEAVKYLANKYSSDVICFQKCDVTDDASITSKTMIWSEISIFG